MIYFKDFAPQITRKGFFKVEYQAFEESLAMANHWITLNNIDVINIEMVVLPQMWNEEGTTDADLTVHGDMMSSWHQFIRVWYRQAGG